jgi:hypothetical protein
MWHAWERRGKYRVVVGKPERKPLGRTRHRWEDGISMDCREIGGGGGLESGSSWVRIGVGGGYCKNGVETTNSVATELVMFMIFHCTKHCSFV